MYTFFRYVQQIFLENVGLLLFLWWRMSIGLLHEVHEGAACENRPPFSALVSPAEKHEPKKVPGSLWACLSRRSNISQIGTGCWTSKRTEAESYLSFKGSVTAVYLFVNFMPIMRPFAMELVRKLLVNASCQIIMSLRQALYQTFKTTKMNVAKLLG